MKLYIQIKEGVPFEHPLMEENFVQAFPSIDVNNLPEEWSVFERVAEPTVGVYELIESCSYQIVEGVVKDVWVTRNMTTEEKLEQQNKVKSRWSGVRLASWIFDEATCSFKPPVAMPTDGKEYTWDEPTTSWIEI
jgi:hypothetical protein